jgi:hypothetical protein
MATFPTSSFGGDLLDQLSGHTTALAIYTVPPTKAGGGTEAQRVTFSLAASVDGGVGRTSQRTGTNVLFLTVPVDSSDLLGIAIVDDDTDEILVVDDAWTPVNTFSAGANMLVDALTVFTEN